MAKMPSPTLRCANRIFRRSGRRFADKNMRQRKNQSAFRVRRNATHSAPSLRLHLQLLRQLPPPLLIGADERRRALRRPGALGGEPECIEPLLDARPLEKRADLAVDP